MFCKHPATLIGNFGVTNRPATCSAVAPNPSQHKQNKETIVEIIAPIVLAHGKNIPNENTPSNGPPMIPNIERAACSFNL